MFSRTVEELRRGVEKGWHTGGQLWVCHKGLVLDHAFGESRPGVPMRTDSLLQWFSSGKPITAIAVGRLIEQEKLVLSEPVGRYIPEFATQGKEAVRVFHLLNHTAGLRLADKLSPELPWKEMIRRICETPLEVDWVPGEKAGYSTQAAWYVLAEMIHRLTDQALDEYVRDHVFKPVGLENSWLRLSFDEFRGYGDRLGLLQEKKDGHWQPVPLQDAEGMAMLRPGSSARGPVRELGLFYRMLLEGGTVNGQEIVKAETVRTFTQRHRTGLYDHTFYHTLDFGYGFIIDSNDYGKETVPYGYGRHCSPETFGHSGAQSSCAFADPPNELAVAWVMNGLPGERPHQERQRELNSAIYLDLGLA